MYPSSLLLIHQDIPQGNIEDRWEEGIIHLESLKATADFIGVRPWTIPPLVAINRLEIRFNGIS